jgi:hypothetical protein
VKAELNSNGQDAVDSVTGLPLTEKIQRMLFADEVEEVHD